MASTFRSSSRCWWPHLGLGDFWPPALQLEFRSCQLALGWEGGEVDSLSSLVNGGSRVSWHSILLPACRPCFESCQDCSPAVSCGSCSSSRSPCCRIWWGHHGPWPELCISRCCDAGEHREEGYLSLLGRVCSTGGQMKKLSRITSSRLIAFLKMKMCLVSNWLFQWALHGITLTWDRGWQAVPTFNWLINSY